MRACTIVTTAQLPFARVLDQSLRAVDPSGELSVLLLDDREHAFEDESFRLLRPEQLAIDDFAGWAALAPTGDALAGIAMPWLLRQLLEQGLPHAVWLDPQVSLIAAVEDLAQLAEQHGVALVPRFDPLDTRPHEAANGNLTGLYDSGIFALGPDSQPLLDWWCDSVTQVRDPDRIGPRRDLSVLDRALAIHANTTVLNLNGDRLRAFNFRDFDPSSPYWLPLDDGSAVIDNPLLSELCRGYAGDLHDQGHDQLALRPYGFERAAGGVLLTDELRRLYVSYRSEGNVGDLFSSDGAAAFGRWLAELEPQTSVGRGLRTVYERRDDLRVQFPDIDGPDAARLLEWARSWGRAEEPLLAAIHGPGDLPVAPRPAPPGVNLIGYLRDAKGLGEAARLYGAALDAAGVPVATQSLDVPRHRIAAASREAGAGRDRSTAPAPEPTGRLEGPINLVCLNGPEHARLAEGGFSFPEAAYTVGVWAWEAQQLPAEWSHAVSLVDEIWVYSSFVAALLAPVVDVPVVTVPLPIVATDPGDSDPGISLPDGFKFVYCFDHFSTLERKNPLAVIDAFKRAFDSGEGPQLVIKSVNAAHWPRQHEQLRFAALDRPDIHVVDAYLDRSQMAALIESCACFVSLHRSEGFGLLLGEAMALGKPVIATGYSGNTDFMTPSNSYPVGYSLTEATRDSSVYPAGSTWAEPDAGHAARLMREVWADPDEARDRGERARADVEQRFSLEHTAKVARDRIELIAGAIGPGRFRTVPPRATRATKPEQHSNGSAPPALDGPRPPLSVIVATTHPWPAVEETLDVIYPQVAAVGGELVLADSDGAGLPGDFAERYAGTIWLRQQGASVFALRALGVGQARGELVTMTEDHCIVAPDWCERVLAAHRERPDAKAIGGAVENASTESLSSWASYLFTFGAFAPPFQPGLERVAPPANISYKRSVLPGGQLQAGWMDYQLNPALFHAGEVALDERISIAHDQPVNIRRACAIHFHNGRATTGLSANGMPLRKRLTGAGQRLRRPAAIFRETMRSTRGKGSVRRKTLAAAPIIGLIAISHGLGEAAGVLAGPGSSPEALD